MHSPEPNAERPDVRYPVLKLPKLELYFACGSLLWLQQINNDPLVRVIEHEGNVTAVDLRELCPALEADYSDARASDRAGVIFFHVKLTYKTLPAFLAAAAAMPINRRRVPTLAKAEMH